MNYFKDENKLGILLTNQFYHKLSHRNKEVKDLPSVNDDHMNIKQTMLMAGILPQNIIELRNSSHKDMENLREEVYQKLKPLTRDLEDPTGIYGL